MGRRWSRKGRGRGRFSGCGGGRGNAVESSLTLPSCQSEANGEGGSSICEISPEAPRALPCKEMEVPHASSANPPGAPPRGSVEASSSNCLADWLRVSRLDRGEIDIELLEFIEPIVKEGKRCASISSQDSAAPDWDEFVSV